MAVHGRVPTTAGGVGWGVSNHRQALVAQSLSRSVLSRSREDTMWRPNASRRSARMACRSRPWFMMRV